MDIWQLALEQLTDAPLVRAVQIRVQEADGDRLDAVVAKPRRHLPDRTLVEGDENRAGCVAPLRDPEAPVARHERSHLLEQWVIQRRARLPRDLQDVPEALGGQERGAPDLALDDRVRRRRRRVDRDADLARVDVRVGQHPEHRIHEAHRESVLGRTADLGDRDHAGLLVDERRVGERPAYVRSDSITAHVTPPSRPDSQPGRLGEVHASSESTTTPYTLRARSGLTLPSLTSRRTSSGSRSKGYP